MFPRVRPVPRFSDEPPASLASVALPYDAVVESPPSNVASRGDDVPVDLPVDVPEASPLSQPAFTLRFSNGDSIGVTSGGLLGRNPVAGTGEHHEHLIIVTDHDRTVSKTHLEFGIEAGEFWVCDRFSGNGTTVHEPGRPVRRLVPGRRYRIVPGTTVGIGEQAFTVT